MAWAAKIDLLAAERVPVASFTFGCPDREVIDRLHRAGSEAWVTVTTPDEARQAVAAGCDVLVLQGVEAGGHRAVFRDDPGNPSDGVGLLALLQLVRVLASDAPTAVTRAFTGRLARGIRNRFLDQHTAQAPAAYPEVHFLTAPLRRAARAAGDPDLVNLWAGQAHQLGREIPAGQLVRELAAEARAAARQASQRLSGTGG